MDTSQNIFNQPERFTKNERRKRYQILSYITTLTVVFFSVIFFSISENFEALIAFIFAGLFSLNQLLSRFTKSLITIHIFFVTLSLTVAFFGACGGANSGNYLYYFPEVIAIIWLYHTQKEKRYIFFQISFLTALLILQFFFKYSYFENLSLGEHQTKTLFYVNLCFSIFIFILLLALTLKDFQIELNRFLRKIKYIESKIENFEAEELKRIENVSIFKSQNEIDLTSLFLIQSNTEFIKELFPTIYSKIQHQFITLFNRNIFHQKVENGEIIIPVSKITEMLKEDWSELTKDLDFAGYLTLECNEFNISKERSYTLTLLIKMLMLNYLIRNKTSKHEESLHLIIYTSSNNPTEIKCQTSIENLYTSSPYLLQLLNTLLELLQGEVIEYSEFEFSINLKSNK